MRRRRPKTKVPGSPLERRNRAAQAGEISWPLKSTPPEPNARRPRLSRPFPCPSLRYYFRRPSLLDVRELERLEVAEEAERETLRRFAESFGEAA